MELSISTEERLAYLTIMAGSGNRILYDVYSRSDAVTRERILQAMAASMEQLEPVMDQYGLARDADGIARAMMLTEDLIGCEPQGELLSSSPEKAVRKVTFCPWATLFSADGETCRLVMAAMEASIGETYGFDISCVQNMAEGADHCIWTVRKKKTPAR